MEFFDKWDTTPVKTSCTFKPEEYTFSEWETKLKIEHLGSDLWERSAWESDLNKLEM